MTRLIYEPETVADVQAAFEWYENERPGLGDEFLRDLELAERHVLRSPLAFRAVHRDARRCLLQRFPYQVLYRIADDVVIMVGCFHVRRSGRAVRERAR